MTADERQRLIDEAPWVIGNLPGLPFGIRDLANRRMVSIYQQYPQTLTADQLKLMADLRNILKLEESQGVANPPIQLVALDLTREVPKAAVGYGNVDTATHTTWQVPGMASDAHLAMESWDEASRNLYISQAAVGNFSGTNAVVAWLGYDTPNPPPGDFGVLSSQAASTGAVRFAAELDGSHAARSAGEHSAPIVNVLAHSYGTTVATIALTLISKKNPVDTLTMLGSAGLDTKRVPNYDALQVKAFMPGQKAIFTTHAAGDNLAPLGAGASGRGQPNPHAVDPLGMYRYSPVYGGGLSFSAEGDASKNLKSTDGHSTIGEGQNPGAIGLSASAGHGYLDEKTQSLDSVAQIATGAIGSDLKKSFTRTEAECVSLVSGNGSVPVPYRTKCEDD